MIKLLFYQRSRLFFIMRITLANMILLGMLITVSYAAPVSGQEMLERRVSIDVKDKQIKEVLSEIENKAEVKFTYRPRLVKANRKVSISVSEAKVSQVLDLLFEAGIRYEVIEDQIVLMARETTLSNDYPMMEDILIRTITGKITDASGPLPGVNIIEKGTNNGTTTDADGIYVIDVSNENATLVFSYIGFVTKEIVVGSRTTIDVAMEADIRKLQEVVVTALGIKREQKALGYAVQNVSGENLQKVSGIDVATSLTGKVAGVLVGNSSDFGALPNISVRGENPLIVIDGVAYGNKTLSDVSSEDIETINVLKGATASALYGVRGQSGAIMITTKKGSSSKETVTVNFTSNTMFTAGYLAIPEKQSTYGRGGNNKYEANSDASWGVPLDGRTITQWDPIAKAFKDKPYLPVGKDNFKNFLEQGYVTNNNLNVAFQKDKVAIRNSFNWAENKGRYPNSKLDRYTYLFGVDVNLDKFKISTNASYAKKKSPNLGSNGYTSYDPMYTLLIWSSPDFDIRDYKNNYWISPGQIQNNWFGLQPDGSYTGASQNNPYFDRYQRTNEISRDIFNADVNASYDVANWLKATVRSGLDFYKETGEIRVSQGSYLYSGNTPVPGNPYTWNGYRTGAYVLGESSGFSQNSDILLTGQRSVQQFDIEYLAGGSIYYKKDQLLTAATNGGISVPEFFSIAASVNSPTVGQQTYAQQINSLYGRVSVSWKKLAYLEASGRNDWTSTLPKDNRSYFYPSIASSVVLSDILPQINHLDLLKIRNSFTVSKQIPGIYEAVSSYSLSNATWGTLNGASAPSSLYPPGLKPSTANTFETGLQAIGFNNRINVDVAYYRKRFYDGIINGPLSQATGYGSTKINTKEETIRKGWEVALKGTVIRNTNWQWDMGVNWTTYKTVFSKLDPTYSAKNPWVYVGARTDAYNIQNFLRVPSTGELILSSSGRLQKSSYYSRVGYWNPDYILGFNTNVRYKGFSLWASFDGVVGGLMPTRTESYMWQSGNHPNSVNEYRAADVADPASKTYLVEGVKVISGTVTYDPYGNITSDTRQYAPNDVKNTYKQYVNDLHNSSAWGGSATPADSYAKTFIKLREISLTYTIPSQLLRGVARAASVSLVGQNVFLWAKDFKYSDPDGGNEDFSDPAVRYMGFKVNLTF